MNGILFVSFVSLFIGFNFDIVLFGLFLKLMEVSKLAGVEFNILINCLFFSLLIFLLF